MFIYHNDINFIDGNIKIKDKKIFLIFEGGR